MKIMKIIMRMIVWTLAKILPQQFAQAKTIA